MHENDREENRITEDQLTVPLVTQIGITSQEVKTSITMNGELIDENDEVNQENQIGEIPNMNPSKRTMCGKYFSKVEAGSLRASIFSLSILSIGVGCLALPQSFSQISVLLCGVEVICAALSTYWTLGIIIEAGRKKEIRNYSLLIAEYCGKGWAVFFDVVIVIYVFGILILYQIISKHQP